uniref:Long-chain-fatty-acid--CoA ligase n=1 Tax=uncultured bacterium esnapd15 TaxID=1366595 RepID=S5UBL9_9BACT|nr:long-chain-fatty-acid--CoA ligase [uncultured bacterium esnapd15]
MALVAPLRHVRQRNRAASAATRPTTERPGVPAADSVAEDQGGNPMSYDMATAPDLVTLIRQHVAERPDAEAVGFLADPDDIRGGVVSWTYERLDREVRGYAAWLQERLPAGSRVLLLHPNGLEFVTAFFGCIYAGMIAVPAPLPGRYPHHQHRVATISANADVSAVLTTAAHLSEVREWARACGLEHLLIAVGDEPGFGDAAGWTPPSPDRATIALVQYTSGSTADPKGVMVTHDNILYNLDVSARRMRWQGDWRVGGWVPLYHDLAMQGLLNIAVLRGSYALLMEPLAFARQPVRWLRTIADHDLQVTFAPTFAYELCLDRVTDEQVATLDLSGWKIAGNASEPVNPAVLAAFAEKFAPAGFRPESFAPIYGMAEATAYITGEVGREPVVRAVDLVALAGGRLAEPAPGAPVRKLVGCGTPNDACDIRVVDPETSRVRPDGWLGEIWVRGRSVSPGYWRNADRAFAAVTADGEDGFLRTGDLGVLEDGELYVHGRLKETLTVHGRNLYPHDVEQELRTQHPELGKGGAVFSGQVASDGDAQGVVVTHEVTNAARNRLPELAAALRHTVEREFGFPVSAVLLLRPGAVLRTTSGKIRRSAMRQLFHEGKLAALYQHSSAPQDPFAYAS